MELVYKPSRNLRTILDLIMQDRGGTFKYLGMR